MFQELSFLCPAPPCISHVLHLQFKDQKSFLNYKHTVPNSGLEYFFLGRARPVWLVEDAGAVEEAK